MLAMFHRHGYLRFLCQYVQVPCVLVVCICTYYSCNFNFNTKNMIPCCLAVEIFAEIEILGPHGGHFGCNFWQPC